MKPKCQPVTDPLQLQGGPKSPNNSLVCDFYFEPAPPSNQTIVTGSSAATGQGQARLGGRIQEGSPAAEAIPPSAPSCSSGADRHIRVGGLHSPTESRRPGESRRRRQDESQEPVPREQSRAAEEAVGGRQTTESGHGRSVTLGDIIQEGGDFAQLLSPI